MDFTSPKKLKSNSINFVDDSATTNEKDTYPESSEQRLANKRSSTMLRSLLEPASQ